MEKIQRERRKCNLITLDREVHAQVEATTASHKLLSGHHGLNHVLDNIWYLVLIIYCPKIVNGQSVMTVSFTTSYKANP